MAAITICSDLGAPKKQSLTLFSTVSPSISHEVMGPDAMVLEKAEEPEIKLPTNGFRGAQ